MRAEPAQGPGSPGVEAQVKWGPLSGGDSLGVAWLPSGGRCPQLRYLGGVLVSASSHTLRLR